MLFISAIQSQSQFNQFNLVLLIYGVTEVHVTTCDFALAPKVQVDPRVFIEINNNQRNAIRLRDFCERQFVREKWKTN